MLSSVKSKPCIKINSQQTPNAAFFTAKISKRDKVDAASRKTDNRLADHEPQILHTFSHSTTESKNVDN